ncbi:hypothetical protein DSUL_50155 [Desulfovibrionales bacterium]
MLLSFFTESPKPKKSNALTQHPIRMLFANEHHVHILTIKYFLGIRRIVNQPI